MHQFTADKQYIDLSMYMFPTDIQLIWYKKKNLHLFVCLEFDKSLICNHISNTMHLFISFKFDIEYFVYISSNT